MQSDPSAAATLAHPRTTAFAPSRGAVLAYGLTCYAIGMTGLFWFILACLGLVPFTGAGISIASTPMAITFSLSFLVLFGVQHAIMARPAFKERWTRIIPEPMERSTFVLLAGGILAAAMAFWQPMPALVWSITNPVLATTIVSIAVLGWLYLLAASFAINHFELFGLQQVWNHFRGNPKPKLPLVSRLMYRFDRHPLMTGILFGVWFTPVMTLDHLVLALGLTTFIVIGVSIEERTLVQLHGDGYRAYRRKVGALVPLPGRQG